jgi:hypothetical protein
VKRTVKTAKPRRWKRRLAIAGLVAGVLVGAMWGALHAFPDFGPVMADGARKVLGPGAVAWAEDLVYGAEDQIHLAVTSDRDFGQIRWPRIRSIEPLPRGGRRLDGEAQPAVVAL